MFECSESFKISVKEECVKFPSIVVGGGFGHHLRCRASSAASITEASCPPIRQQNSMPPCSWLHHCDGVAHRLRSISGSRVMTLLM